MNSLATLLRRAYDENRPLAITGIAMLVALALALVGILIDPRIITGMPAWVKPAKFAISITIYCYTFAWLLSYVEGRRRLKRIASNVTVAAMIIEMAGIVLQAARGTTSHFNTTTTFNTFIWSLMGAVIMIAFFATALLAVMLIRQALPDRAFAWSLRLGIVVTLVGMAAAIPMTQPTAQQLAMHGPHSNGAHTVGTPDGGPGLPFVGWSTVAGDLRVPHFVGLHALQVLPFLGWLVTRRKSLRDGQKMALVWLGGLSYLGLVLILLWQALKGQSVIQPDSATLTAFGLLATTAGLSALLVWAAASKEVIIDSRADRF